MAKVIIRQSAYEYPRLKEDVHAILGALDTGLIKRGAKVLIKPNLLTAALPEQAVVTHPLIVKAAAEYALQRGAEVQISDSNGMSTFPKLIAQGGFADALKSLPVRVAPFIESRKVSVGGTFKTLELAEDAFRADVVINLPKLKTHGQMGMTLAVKNLFGCVVGPQKPEWHFRIGENKDRFAELLVSVHEAIGPRINLLDGILALEGMGPGTSGKPRHIGVLMGSTSALAIDMAVCRMMGLQPEDLRTNRAYLTRGGDGLTEIDGALPDVSGFDIPGTQDMLFGPKFARKFIRRHISSRPTNIPEQCKYCNECVNICPARAITNVGKKLVFDYEKCIRCYCCLEACPHGAMRKHDTLLRKITWRLINFDTTGRGKRIS